MYLPSQLERTPATLYVMVDIVKGGWALGGFNFILFWNFNRNQMENDRYWQKDNFLLSAKCLKMYIFSHLH